MTSLLYETIYAVVRQIPVGRVATYGQVARWAGYPGYARQVGYALFRLPPQETDVPWQRVVNARGEISMSPLRFGSDDWQRSLLEAEGVSFDSHNRIDLTLFGWDQGEHRTTYLKSN